MKSLHLVGSGHFALIESDCPVSAPDEVLIKVSHVGICGTDIHILEGKMGDRIKLPIILGHEISGTIVSDISHQGIFSRGQRVIVKPMNGCGDCVACAEGLTNQCRSREIVGVDRPGGLSEYISVPANCAYALPDDVDLLTGCLVEPCCVAYHALRRSLSAAPDAKTVLIIGAGFIGTMIGFLALLSGVRRIFISEVLPSRRRAAKRYFREVLDGTNSASFLQEISRKTDSGGVDVVFETSGAEDAASQMVSACKIGGVVTQVGFHESPPRIDMWQVVRKELTVMGSYSANHTDYTAVIDLVGKGKILPRELVSNVIALKDMQKAVPLLLDRDKYLKNVVAVE